MLKELFEKQKPLMFSGAFFFVCFIFLIIVSLFDSTEILGINRWIKPSKFLVSTAIFFWTTAIYLSFLKEYTKSICFISRAMIFIFFIEIFLVVMQAARGTTSHFNVKNDFDGILYAIMGVFITLNTLLVAYLLFLYFRAEINRLGNAARLDFVSRGKF